MKTCLTASAVLMLAGCSSPWLATRSLEDEVEDVPRVIVVGHTLQDILRAGEPLVERMQPEGFLRVVVPIRNIDDEPVQIAAEVRFFDSAHHEVPDEVASQVLILPAQGTSNCQAISRGVGAADFELVLRWDT